MATHIEDIRDKILPILKRYGVRRASVFGSSVKGSRRGGSDIDLLVEIEKDISLFDFVGLKLEIEETLCSKVDLVEFEALKPLLRKKILDEQVVIL
ncbi:MAG: nucleotidyltransferase family protein [Calditrichaeota bacterium]|nr:nucleotidyltransferase family protein [Calditrichota bacterium]